MLLKTQFGMLSAGLMIAALTGCAQSAQDLQSVNQSIQGTQQTIDNANTMMQQAPAADGSMMKEAGKQMIMQNPAVKEANETVDSSKRLMDSMKSFGKQPPQK